ncbi:hypothetical protein [Streptomyces niveus]|uniref:hypothetical protein n=1 Tax=Streptomyces niveus TaxID=193462 RepID=UPI0038B44A38
MGRLMYDSGVEFWGDNPPFHTPVFVLTNRPAPTLVKEGGTSFTFVTDGIHSALDQAKAAAGGRNVDIAGGADTVQQYLRARLVDELQRPRTDPRGGHPRRPGWVRETLAILGMDPAPGTPVADLARVYVNAVEGTSNGSTFTPPATPSQPSR